MAFRVDEFHADDRDAVVRVVRTVFEEYEFTWDDSDYFSDIRDPQTHYIEAGGMFWVARAEGVDNLQRGHVVGCVGLSTHEGFGELHRMYLYREYRGRGIGRRLLDTGIDHLKSCGIRRMLLWSDVKFTDAHRLYERNGFKRIGERICDDPDANREYGYAKEPL